MTMDELFQLQFFTDMVTIPDEVYDTLSKIRNELRDEESVHLTDDLNSLSLCFKRRL